MENRKSTLFSKLTSKGFWPQYAELRLCLLKHPVSVECCKSHVRFCCLLKWLSGVVPSNWGAIKNYVELSRAYFSIWETYSKKLKNHSATISVKILTKIPTRILTRIPTNIPTRISTRIPTSIPTRILNRIPTRIPTRIPNRIPF